MLLFLERFFYVAFLVGALGVIIGCLATGEPITATIMAFCYGVYGGYQLRHDGED